MFSFLSAAVSCLLAAVTLDLSQYAMDVGKAVASKCVCVCVCKIDDGVTSYIPWVNQLFISFITLHLCVSGQLKANNPQLMQEAVQAMQNLAQQCSDPTSIQEVVTHLFLILGGRTVLRRTC